MHICLLGLPKIAVDFNLQTAYSWQLQPVCLPCHLLYLTLSLFYTLPLFLSLDLSGILTVALRPLKPLSLLLCVCIWKAQWISKVYCQPPSLSLFLMPPAHPHLLLALSPRATCYSIFHAILSVWWHCRYSHYDLRAAAVLARWSESGRRASDVSFSFFVRACLWSGCILTRTRLLDSRGRISKQKPACWLLTSQFS